MISIDKVTLNVRDQDAAKAFWVETMGFELVQDQPMGEPGGPRWIEVRPPGTTVTLVLFSPEFEPGRVGQLGNLLFTCEDIRTEHAELSARGVDFPDAPVQQDWGWWATFRDNEGNLYGLGQRD
jgi:lactoylglutathione lyase